MLRKIPTTSVTRSLFLPNARRSFFSRAPPSHTLVLAQKSPLGLSRAPRPRSLISHVRLFTTTSPRWKRAPKTGGVQSEEAGAKLEAEFEKARHKKLEVRPEEVTTTSSLTPIFGGLPKVPPKGEPPDDIDMLKGLKSDFHVIKETFALKEVPKEAYWIGIGGTFPYAWVSAWTLYLAWEVNYAHHHGIGYLISAEAAEQVLQFVEPLQVGLGAVILSFLGAVHWGLEMAEYGGKHGYKRYVLSVLAPGLAWPTMLLPFDYALITQFLGFTGMYFADSTATGWGWAPPWYMTYRFILTFIVGTSIVITLVVRGQLGDQAISVPGPASHLQEREDERRIRLRNQVAEENRKAAKAKLQYHDGGDEERAAKPGERAEANQQGEHGVHSGKGQGVAKGEGVE